MVGNPISAGATWQLKTITNWLPLKSASVARLKKKKRKKNGYRLGVLVCVKSDLVGHYRGEANLDQCLAMLPLLFKLSLKASADGTVWETMLKLGH